MSPHSSRSHVVPVLCTTSLLLCAVAFCADTVFEIIPQTDERGAKNTIAEIDLRDVTPDAARAFGEQITTRHYGYGGPRNILTFLTDFPTKGLFILDIRAASSGGADLLVRSGDAAHMKQWPPADQTHQVGQLFAVPIAPGEQKTVVEVLAGTVVVDRYLVFPDESLVTDVQYTPLDAYSEQQSKADGYRGIWYYNQKSNDEYVYKYSGGLATYTAKHIPLAVYSEKANKTFFVYGGTVEGQRRLLMMASYYDHATHQVPRPTVICDKRTGDAHDNPVIALDDDGYIWVFASSHGTSRPSFIYKSEQPYSTDAFELVRVTNFSYPQVHYVPGKGFLFLQTLYQGGRRLFSQTSADGVEWSEPTLYARIAQGHYQVSGRSGDTVACAFNYHPAKKGLNWRTNLYYMQTRDMGQTWQNVRGQDVATPLVEINNDALVHDYEAEGLNVYMKDLNFDMEGRPVILVVTSKGYESGPKNDPRTWTVFHWVGDAWEKHEVCTSDNNYDMGSIYIEENEWTIIGPTQRGPQPYNPGGEVAMWKSTDEGKTWSRTQLITEGSPYNHTYVRRPVNAHPGFYGFWADGHGRRPSDSRLYFTDRSGEHTWRLPPKMEGDFAEPELVSER